MAMLARLRRAGGLPLLLGRVSGGRTAGAAATFSSSSSSAGLALAEYEEDLETFRDQVRHFAQNEVAPYAHQVDEMNAFPDLEQTLWQKMGDFGLHGLTVAENIGGLGLGYAYHCVAMEEISRASGAVGLSYGAHR